MLTFKTVEVLKTCDNMHYVTWEVASEDADILPIPPEDNPDDYYYVTYWSNDPVSGFHSIKNDDGTDVQIDGASGPLEFSVKHYRKHYNFNIKYYYTVVGYNKISSNVAFKSDVVYFGRFSDGTHIQMKHAEDTLYEMYYGEPTLLIKRKSFGEPCPNCWSEERGQRIKSNCPVCQNTGKVYGYYQPIQVQMSYDSDPVKSDVQKNYEVVVDTKRARISNYPIVRPRDLIINLDDNKRYTITNVETTKLPLRATHDRGETRLSHQNYVVSQLLSTQEIPADDQEYFMNYNNIPEECEDYSLPRFQAHPAATGDAPITVDSNQVIRLSYTDDFTVDMDGKLKLKSPLDKPGALEVEYLYNGGFNGNTNIPATTENLVPELPLETKIRSIKIAIDMSGSINQTNPAIIRVAEYDHTSDIPYGAGTGVTKYLNNFIEPIDQDGVKYYTYFTIDVSADNIVLTPGKAIFIDIDPNDSWTFDTARVTLDLEVRN